MRTKYTLYTLILFLLSVATVSCVEETLEDCFSGVRLRFRFTLHEEPEKGNLFGQNVEHLKVYVFDQDGILQQIAEEKGATLTNDYVMPLALDSGQYSIIAWAADHDELARTHRELDAGTSRQAYTEPEIGKSRMEDIRMLLDTQEASDYPEDVKPSIDNFDDLYFGALGGRSSDGTSQYTIIPIEVTGDQVIEREIEMIRNTNIVRITVEGLESLSPGGGAPADLLDIWMTGANTQYRHTNLVDPQAPTVRYFPQYTLPTPNLAQADVKIERLEWARPGGEPMKLHVRLKTGRVLYSGDFVSLLKEAKDSDGNYIYKNQEDLDRIYVHPIRFAVEDAHIKVFIHNWEVVKLITDL